MTSPARTLPAGCPECGSEDVRLGAPGFWRAGVTFAHCEGCGFEAESGSGEWELPECSECDVPMPARGLVGGVCPGCRGEVACAAE